MELLIAFTIFSIIAASIYYTLSAGIRVYRRGNTMIRDNQKLRIFFDSISRDLRNAIPYGEESDSKKKPTSISITTETSGLQTESEWLTDRASFLTLINVFGEDRMHAELARVSYYIDTGPRKGKKLIRKCATVKDGFDEEIVDEGDPLEGLEDFILEDFSFEYCYEVTGFEDEFDWRDEEFEDGMPQGVKIMLTLKNKARETEATFVETVFIPMGKLGSDTE